MADSAIVYTWPRKLILLTSVGALRAVTTIEATVALASVKILTTKLTAPVITTNSTDYQPHPHQYDLCSPV